MQAAALVASGQCRHVLVVTGDNRLTGLSRDGAVAALVEGIAESAALDGFVDGPQTAYRAFDSYVARTLYNRALVRARQGSSS